MQLEEHAVGDWKVLTPEMRRLDAHVADDVREALLTAVANGANKIVVDLHHVEFMDSSGLGAIVHCYNRVRECGCLAVSGAQPAVASLLRLTQLDKVLEVVDHPESLLEDA